MPPIFRHLLAGVALLWAAPTVLCAENAPLPGNATKLQTEKTLSEVEKSAPSDETSDTLKWHVPDLALPRVKSSANTSVLSAGLITRDRNLSGVQLNLLAGDVEQRLRGLQLSAFISLVRGRATGVQIAPLYNYAQSINGVQFSTMLNITESAARGWQASSTANIAIEGDGLLQMALTNVVLGQLRGVQFGATNYAGALRGLQFGVVNVTTGETDGPQIGLINSTRDTTALKIGLVNLTPNTRVQLMLFGGNTTKSNVGVRFLNHHFYTLLGFGLYYRGLDDHFSGALFYRAGYRHAFSPRFALSADLGLAHIEDSPVDAEKTELRRLAFQARLNAEYRIAPQLSFFATGGWSRAHRYGHFKDAHRKPIVELGLMLF